MVYGLGVLGLKRDLVMDSDDARKTMCQWIRVALESRIGVPPARIESPGQAFVMR